MTTDSLTLARQSDSLPETVAELEARFELATHQRRLLEDYIRARLKPGRHTYLVHGSSKFGLSKEGAELICLPHGLKPQYIQNAGPHEPSADGRPYQITVTCRLMRGDIFGGEGMGSASSHVTRRDGSTDFRQRDPGLCHNATLKMAQKSAYIAATLNATAASEFFTQDMEDASDDAATPALDRSNWCEEHQDTWFKKGNMRGFAHPIKDKPGSWCSKPSERKVPAKHPPAEASAEAEGEFFDLEPTVAQPAALPALTETAFYRWMASWGKSASEVQEVLGGQMPKVWLANNPTSTYRDIQATCAAKWNVKL